MIIVISGSVGSGKTTLAKELGEKLKLEVVNLNDFAKEFKIKDVNELQTFDFNIDKLVAKVNREIADGKYKKGAILEGHFAHFLNPELIDYLFVVNRDLKQLERVYKERNYNEQKIKDNLEVESFNLCFYEGVEEGFREEEQIFCLQNNTNVFDLVKEVEHRIKN
jgi:adenylate kinase